MLAYLQELCKDLGQLKYNTGFGLVGHLGGTGEPGETPAFSGSEPAAQALTSQMGNEG